MSKATTLAKRIQAGARMASKARLRVMTEAAFDRWLKDRSPFGVDTPTMLGHGIEGVAVGTAP